jgi:hypothetical protein
LFNQVFCYHFAPVPEQMYVWVYGACVYCGNAMAML